MNAPDMRVLARIGAQQRLTELREEEDRLMAFVDDVRVQRRRTAGVRPVRRNQRTKPQPRKRMGGKVPAVKVHWTQRPENRARVRKHLARISQLRGTFRAS